MVKRTRIRNNSGNYVLTYTFGMDGSDNNNTNSTPRSLVPRAPVNEVCGSELLQFYDSFTLRNYNIY